MSSSPPIEINQDFRDMLGLLLKHNVRFLLIGGYALGIHAEPRFTQDMDFFIQPTPDNAQKLWEALAEYGAPLHLFAMEDFANAANVVQIGVAPNRIDFTMSIQGVSFDDAWRERLQVEFASQMIPVINRKHLILNKQAVGRPKDLADVRALLKNPPAAATHPWRKKNSASKKQH